MIPASRYYVDAAYCYSGSSVACLSVCLSVYHDREPCQKTAEPIEMLIELANHGYYIRWLTRSTETNVYFFGDVAHF